MRAVAPEIAVRRDGFRQGVDAKPPQRPRVCLDLYPRHVTCEPIPREGHRFSPTFELASLVVGTQLEPACAGADRRQLVTPAFEERGDIGPRMEARAVRACEKQA